MNARSTALRGLAVVVLMIVSVDLTAHPGGLNAEGCHNNRKTGDYHCHRASAIQRAQQAAATPAPPASAVPQPSAPAAPTCHTGPRGGRYTITKSGKKNYHGC
ncbi:YHYH domain-containing protein [Pelomonas sp. Root1217]|uniref:YHYH domain-containing protein n=1 Tax=Pelomonas sp. Root1217 TaxID=1736430 RepID=UPI000A8DFA75|nr:YHYH domain-containing protein [Pelomonas sp. Root1217]